MIQILPVKISADIEEGDNLAEMIVSAAHRVGLDILDGDVVVVAQKVVSKAEGRVVDLDEIKPSKKAVTLAKSHGKDPRLVEVILRESSRVLRAQSGVIITETHHGFVCANSAVDQSNVSDESQVILLPVDPDRSAERLRKAISDISKSNIAILITDTFGRPFRNGQTNVAIGVAGMDPLRSYIGSKDMYGKRLRVTEIAVADEIASAAELVMGKAERIPVAIVRGYGFNRTRASSIKSLLRDRKRDLFR